MQVSQSVSAVSITDPYPAASFSIPLLASYLKQCGLILVDVRGHIIAVNCAAQQMLKTGEIVRREGRLLCGVAPYQAAMATSIRRVVRMASEYAGYTMPISTGELPVTVVIRAHTAGSVAALVVISNPNETFAADKKLIMAVYRTTAAEATVAAKLARGLSVAEVAESCGVNVSTIRTHLKRLFQKTGAKRQTELILILAVAHSCVDEFKDLT